MRWGLLLLVACGGDRSPAAPTSPSSATTSTAIGPTTTPGDDTATPSSTKTELPWGGCPCPETYDADTWNSWQEISAKVGRPTHVPARETLVLFLHGTGQSSLNHDRILRTVNHAGFPVVAVEYPSTPGIDWCQDNVPDDQFSGCVEELRNARLYGAEFPGSVYVSDESSITARLLNALQAAAVTDPKGPWTQFYDPPPAYLTDHEHYLRWDRILVAGFSQGAALSAVLARDESTAGLFMISGPVDDRVDWIYDKRATPACLTIGAHHDREDYEANIGSNFASFGLGSTGTMVQPLEDVSCEALTWPPYDGAHRLMSDLVPADACTSDDHRHGSMGNDPCMNDADAPAGDPYALFRPYLGALCWLGEGGDCAQP